jgi:hypothetical protein
MADIVEIFIYRDSLVPSASKYRDTGILGTLLGVKNAHARHDLSYLAA